MLYPLGALPAFSGGGMLGLSAACCPSSVVDSDELVLVEPGRGDSLFVSEAASSAEPLTRVECLLARFVEGDSFTVELEAVAGVSGSVMLTIGFVSIASGEFEACNWFAFDERGISLFRFAVLFDLDIEADDISAVITTVGLWIADRRGGVISRGQI